MKNYLKAIIAILGCQITGLAGSLFTFPAIDSWYKFLNKPGFAPPNWLFGPVWTILYLLMGIAFYLIWIKKTDNKKAIKFFIIQLILNFFWSPLFFGLKMPFLAFVEIIFLWLFILFTILKFYPLSKIAAYLLIPYFLWVSFASILNLSIVLLN